MIVTFWIDEQSYAGLKCLILGYNEFYKKKKYFRPAHSLIYLGKEVGIPSQYLSFLRTLNPEFVTKRYPDAAFGVPYEMYDKEIAEDFISKSEEVLKWIQSQLNE